MSGNRGELHRLVEELDEQVQTDAAVLLRSLRPTRVVSSQPWRRPSMSGAYDSGHTGTAARSAEIVREGLVRRDLQGQ